MARVFPILVAALFAASGPSLAFAAEPGEIGIVLMHGWGLHADPSEHVNPHAWTLLLAQALRKEGFHVVQEEMPWGPNRLLDVSLDKAMEEIDAQVGRLKVDGAKKIVIAGHSMGAAMALAYAARRDGVAAVVGLAPAPHPELGPELFPDVIPAQIAKAKAAVSAGKGDVRMTFKGVQCCFFFRDFSTTANIYLSYFGPDGPATMAGNASRVKPGVAVLMVYGTQDVIFTLLADVRQSYADYVLSRIPPNPHNRGIIIDAGHGEVPVRAARDVIAWLRALP
jgi:pimeloyl-ACP methyl ester carboxylesterase